MAILDSLAIFSRKQKVTETTYSERAMDLKALADYGVGRNAYIECICGGNFSKFLRVQLVGFADETYSAPVVVGDSGVIDKAELVAGHRFYVPFNITDKKYKIIALRYIPSTDAATNDSSATPSAGTAFTADGQYAPPPKVGADPAVVADTISAHLVLTPASQVEYDYANQDKRTV